jgi:predicted MPP superfamily phosphohydrolase
MFFYTVLGVIALCCAWLFFCLRRAFGRGSWQFGFAAWCVFLIGIWYLRHLAPESVMWSALLRAGFVGIGFSAIAAGVCFGVWFTEIVLRRFHPRGVVFQTLARRRLGVSLGVLLAALLSIYSVWEAGNLRVEHVVVSTAKLPAGVQRFRIAMVSDVHLSRDIGPELLQRIADIVNASDADVFVTLGDVVDTDMRGRDKDAAVLRSIRSRYGTYGVLGNHEDYRGLDNSLGFYKRAGIEPLRGRSIAVGSIVLAGVDDPAISGAGMRAVNLVMEMKNRENPGAFVLFLCHRPQAPGVVLRGMPFDLMLSGHTHGGQIQPVGLIFTRLVHKAPSGLGEYGGGLRYVTNGAGYWGPPMRLFAPPEVVIIDLVPESSR